MYVPTVLLHVSCDEDAVVVCCFVNWMLLRDCYATVTTDLQSLVHSVARLINGRAVLLS